MAQPWIVDPTTKLLNRPKIKLGFELPSAGVLGFHSENCRLIGRALSRIFIAANDKIIVSPELSLRDLNLPQVVWNDAMGLGPGSPVSHLAFTSSEKYFILVRKPAYFYYRTADVVRGAQSKTLEPFLQWKAFPVETEKIMKLEFSPINNHRYVYVIGQRLYHGEVDKATGAGDSYEIEEMRPLGDLEVISFAFTAFGELVVGMADGSVKLLHRRFNQVFACFPNQDNSLQYVTKLHRIAMDTLLVQFKTAGQWTPNKLKTLKVDLQHHEFKWGVVENLKDRPFKEQFVIDNNPQSGALSFFSYCSGLPLLIDAYKTVKVTRRSRRVFPICSTPEIFPVDVASFSEEYGRSGVSFVLGSDFGIYPYYIWNANAKHDAVTLIVERLLGLDELLHKRMDELDEEQDEAELKASKITKDRAECDKRTIEIANDRVVLIAKQKGLNQMEEGLKEKEAELGKREEAMEKRETMMNSREEALKQREYRLTKYGGSLWSFRVFTFWPF